MKKGKVLLVLSVTMVTMLGTTLQVSAAPSYADLFDAKYYAENYSDLKDVYGEDEKALYNHYVNYGIYEGRVASEAFDVLSYRENYADLEAAFGDDWKAYVDHYLTYGLTEGRDGGGMFDAVSYANRYKDLKKVFGYDVAKLWDHYEQFGEKEGRNAISQSVVDRWKEESAKVSSASDTYTRTYVDEYDYTIVEKVEKGVLRNKTEYDPDGKLAVIHNYDSRGKETEWINYDSEGNVVYLETYSYDANGLLAERNAISFVENWSFIFTYEYDEYDRISVVKTVCEENGVVVLVYYTDYFYEGTSNVLIKTEERYE